MKRIVALLLLVSLLAGCGTLIESNPGSPTAAPADQNPPPQPATGKCQSQIVGTLTDANGAVVKGATIALKGGGKTIPGLSDDNGRFGFAGQCAGTYTFTVTLKGQPARDLATTATVDGSNRVSVSLSLK